MPNNDFEKQVQQKMDELSFTPSDAVWAEVEKQVRQKKDRRRVLIILLPFVLLLGGMVWYITSGKQSSSINTISKNEKNNPPVGSGKEPTTPEDPAIAKKTSDNRNEQPDIKKTTGTFLKDKSNKPNKEEKIQPAEAIGKAVNKTDGKKEAPPLVKNKRVVNRQLISNNRESSRKAKSLNSSVLVQGRLPNRNETIIASREHSNDLVKDKQHDSTNTATITDTLKTKNQLKVAIAVAQIKQEVKKDSTAVPAVAKNLPAKKKRALQFGIIANAGLSNVSKGLTGLFNSYYYSPSTYNSIIGGGTIINSGPSPRKPGPAFSIGFGMRKELSYRLLLITGITYQYYSNYIQVGTFHDSSNVVSPQANQQKSVDNFYSNSTTGASQQYTNRYHYVSMPIGLEMKMGKKSHFLIETGVVVSRFIASNALQYDYGKGIYYKDNSLFNKTQVLAFAGLAYSLQLKKKATLLIGPRLQYGLTNLVQKAVSGSNHTITGGIGASLFFNKK